MKKYSYVVMGILVLLTLTSCHMMANLDSSNEDTLKALYFNNTMASIKVGGLGYEYITVNPESVLDTNDITYSSSDETVCMIYHSSNTGVVFSGKAAGVVVIKAKLLGMEAKIAVTVEPTEE